MNNQYSNLPPSTKPQELVSIDALYTKPLEIEVGTLDVMKAFFTARGFQDVAAESVAITIIKQAKIDNYKPLEILDTLKGLNDVELSALVAEIINFNRFKTSFLGYAREFTVNDEVMRNILP